MVFNYWSRLLYFLSDFSGYLILLVVSFTLLMFFSYVIYKGKSSELVKKILISILFAVFSFLFIFSCGEAFFRYKYDQTDGLGFLDTNKRWFDRHVQYNNMIYRDNKDYQIEKPSGVTRIGVVGDSLAFGQGIKDVDNRFSNLLETDLKQKGKNVQVYNFGIPGQDICQEIQQFKSIDFIKMDIIVWSYYMNDIQTCNDQSTGTKILEDTLNHINPSIRFLSHISFFFDYLYWRFTALHDVVYRQLRSADLAQYSNPPVLKSHIKDIATFSAQLKYEGIPEEQQPRNVIAITFPLLNLFDSKDPGVDKEKMIDGIIQAQGIEVIDMYQFLVGKKKTDLTTNRFDSHPNEYVNKIAAEKLEEKILPLLP